MAFTKKEKAEMLAQYEAWIEKSEALFMISYQNMPVKEIDRLRIKARETGNEVHITKNTLLKMALEKQGYPASSLLEGTTIVGFAFTDAPGLAKAINEVTKKSEVFAVKGGYLGTGVLNPAQVNALATLPPLPVMRAILLGTIQAPATKLVRTLAEPGRQVAAVIKAYSDAGAPAAA